MAGNNDKRAERLKAALRDNLRKRKARDRTTEPEAAAGDAQEKTDDSSRS